MPDSNDEEEADKQEVQEKDQQKDQQGTFLIATDSNAGDFLEDDEFEDEEIPEDIPVLTDISVTWERMRTGKMKVVSIIIFRFFRESIFGSGRGASGDRGQHGRRNRFAGINRYL